MTVISIQMTKDFDETEQGMIAFKHMTEYQALSKNEKEEYEHLINEYIEIRYEQDIRTRTMTYAATTLLDGGDPWKFSCRGNEVTFHNSKFTEEQKQYLSTLIRIKKTFPSEYMGKETDMDNNKKIYKHFKKVAQWRIRRGVRMTKDNRHWQRYESFKEKYQQQTPQTVTLSCGDEKKEVAVMMSKEIKDRLGEHVTYTVQNMQEMEEKENVLKSITEKFNNFVCYHQFLTASIGGKDVEGQVKLEFEVLSENEYYDAMELWKSTFGLPEQGDEDEEE